MNDRALSRWSSDEPSPAEVVAALNGKPIWGPRRAVDMQREDREANSTPNAAHSDLGRSCRAVGKQLEATGGEIEDGLAASGLFERIVARGRGGDAA
jgi:hypothetical protein